MISYEGEREKGEWKRKEKISNEMRAKGEGEGEKIERKMERRGKGRTDRKND